MNATERLRNRARRDRSNKAWGDFFMNLLKVLFALTLYVSLYSVYKLLGFETNYQILQRIEQKLNENTVAPPQ